MTFLEFVCEQLLGDPTASRGDGQSQWDCPACGSSSFHTMPSNPRYKDRCKCWSCGFRGDSYDLLQQVRPELDYGGRCAWLAQRQQEFDNGEAARALRVGARAGAGVGNGARAKATPTPYLSGDGDYALVAVIGLSQAERATLRAADAIARSSNVPLEELVAAILRAEAAEAESERRFWQYADQCECPDVCDAAVCRLRRGERQLTLEEIRAGMFKHDGHPPLGRDGGGDQPQEPAPDAAPPAPVAAAG
jgi:hypothetical protein